MATFVDQLVASLRKQGALTDSDFKRAQDTAKATSRSLENIIVEEGFVPASVVAKARADILGIPYVDLSSTEIDAAAMKGISPTAAATHRFIAFAQDKTKLKIAIENPENIESVEAARFLARKRGLKLELYVTSRSDIDAILGNKDQAQEQISSALEEFTKEVDASAATGDLDTLATSIEDAPVTKVVAVLIRHAIEGAASDIHIEPSEKELRIRYRIDGTLYTSLTLPRKVHPAVISRVKILASLKIDETRLPQDGRFSTTIDDKDYDFRVASMPTIFGEKVVLRILDKSTGAPTLAELGLSKTSEGLLNQYLKNPNGILLISGPTGAGKSTTLFSALSRMNEPGVNIVTLEDPVEYEIAGVNQTQVRPDIGFNFAQGLRSVLRQDPDVVMVGEIRDKDTAGLAVHAALTGHLVLSTIHTNNAIGTITRLTDLGVDPFLLVASLRLLVAQRLVVQLCQKCKQEAPIDDELKQEIKAALQGVPDDHKADPNQRDPQHLFVSPGCPSCQEGDRLGRIGIFEVIPVSRQLRTAINDPTKYDTLETIARKQGYISMRQDGLLKSLVGQVAYEDVIRATADS